MIVESDDEVDEIKVVAAGKKRKVADESDDEQEEDAVQEKQDVEFDSNLNAIWGPSAMAMAPRLLSRVASRVASVASQGEEVFGDDVRAHLVSEGLTDDELEVVTDFTVNVEVCRILCDMTPRAGDTIVSLTDGDWYKGLVKRCAAGVLYVEFDADEKKQTVVPVGSWMYVAHRKGDAERAERQAALLEVYKHY